MGIYNPYAPQILGQEWVPIREDPLVLTPQTNLVEVGHKFVTTSSKVLQTVRFYVQEYPPGNPLGQVILTAIYRQGNEVLTGPIRSVVIPCSSGTVISGAVDFSPAASIADALANPSDNLALSVIFNSSAIINLRFEVDSYAPLLNGKRILGVDFLYSADITTLPTNGVFATVSSTASTAIDIGSVTTSVNPSTLIPDNIRRIVVGEVDYHWNAPTTNIIEVLPWNFSRLRGFDNSSGVTDRFIQLIVLDPLTLDEFVLFEYAAIEVFYCDETRIMYGGKRLTAGRGIYNYGANLLTVRDLTDAANPTLAAGNYSLILSSANQTTGNPSPYPQLNQIQQLYDIPTHLPVRTIRPYPVDPVALGKTFEAEQTVLLPQLSLHTSGGPLTEVHVYGRQAAAQVYGTITATQEILDSAAGGARSYPWVRYYARRFGTTSIPLKLDSPSIAGSSVELTPEEFDDLDEIVDGWKEVTLRFDTPPTMGAGTQPTWRWSATGEVAGSRWEVLGAIAPALSGLPGNLLNPVQSPHQLSIATYGQPISGASINLGWVPQYAPPVSATVDDQTSDAALMFALDLPTVTGFSSSEEVQEVTGIGLDCGVDPCCIPTEINYIELSWGTPPFTTIVHDTFTRSSSGWGTADTGQTYTDAGGTVPGNYVVNGTEGTHVLDSTNVVRLSTIAGSIADSHQSIIASLNVTPAGSSIRQRLIGHFVDASNYDYVDFRSSPFGNVMEIVVANFIAGVATQHTNVSVGSILADRDWNLVVDFNGTTIRAKAWIVDTPEPSGYQASGTAAFTLGGIGVGSIRSSGNTDAGAIASYDEYTVTPSTWSFAGYELQRMDTVETDWKTIMRATDVATTGFNDYEARVGIVSSYRIRAVDVYDFPGPWSSTITDTVTAPGVTIGCEGGHLLIFTSNEAQDGSLNLAYSSVWEGRVEEAFAFPEAGFVQLQAMYNRDFFTAFRPTERGGEQFQRTVLVQAAAISPETLADFTSLRDMAWADVSYICVRDEDGNRWFATVLVPGGRVMRDRRLYMAPIDIIEVTDTPSEVNP